MNHVAAKYTELLESIPGIVVPRVEEKYYSSWAQYTIQIPGNNSRSSIQNKLKAEGIPTNIYYIKPMHKQGAFSGTVSAQADCPNTEKLCESVLCLPIHPYLEEKEVIFIVEKLKEAVIG